MPDIARLDERGVLVAVETVSFADHLTDPQKRTVALPSLHDMGGRLGGYRYDYLAGCFLPVSTEPLDVAEREVPGLVEGLVEFVEAIERASWASTCRPRPRRRSPPGGGRSTGAGGKR